MIRMTTSSIVSTSMARVICEANGVHFEDTFTGFKFMAERVAAWEAAVDAAGKGITHLEMAARCILDVGCEYRIGPLTLGLNIHNLLGTRYYRSGMNTNLIPQQGRWFMGSIAVRL